VRASVHAGFLDFTGPLEGPGVPCPYTDIRGIVTVAWGDAIFTREEMVQLPFMHAGGVPATATEKICAWELLKDNAAAMHGGWTVAAKLTDLRLTREGMNALAFAKLDSNDRILLARLPEWESYNACAQLALHSLAWACGANAHFPRLFQAVNARDFLEAAAQIHMNEWTPEGAHNAGLVPRNVANKLLMRNAQRIEAFHLDPDLLEWKTLLGVADAVTVPALDDPGSEPTIHRLDYAEGDDPPFEA